LPERASPPPAAIRTCSSATRTIVGVWSARKEPESPISR